MAFLDKLKHTPRWLFFVGVLFGIWVLVMVALLRGKPPLSEAISNAIGVDVLVVQPQHVAPTIEGFGRVEPKQTWQAVSEVGGRVVFRNSELHKGKVLPEGTPLIQIDPTDYRIRLAEAEADFKATQVQLDGISLEENNLNVSLAIEQQQLALTEQELARKKRLKKQNLISQSELDLENQSLLKQRQQVQELENQLQLVPNNRDLLQAQLLQAAARVDEAKRQLDKTNISLPFTARITDVNVEDQQVVGSQQVLVTAHSLDTMMVNSQVSMHDMRTLVHSLTFKSSQGRLLQVSELGMTANLYLEGYGFNFTWPAKVTRISDTVDPSQATVGIFLEVEQDLSQLKPVERPPLVNGMFLRAEITGQPQTVWLLPLKALHGNRIYRMNQEQRLEIIPAELRFFKDQQVAVAADLQPGDEVVLTDLLPAVEGMLLKPLAREVQP